MALKGWYKVAECLRSGKLVRGLFPTDRYSDDCLHETALDTLFRVSASECPQPVQGRVSITPSIGCYAH